MPKDTEELSWDMRDWPSEEQTVEGLVMGLEGCGRDEDRIEVVGEDGTPIVLCGVTQHGNVVRVVVRAAPVAATTPPVPPPA